jgi:hypothetical protein
MVHFAISHYAERPADTDKAAMNCLIARSLLEDGEFVRLTLKVRERMDREIRGMLKEALRQELREPPIRPDLRVWFVQHLGFSLMLHLYPKKPAINYKASKEALIEQATWFALLGVGLKEEAINRHYNPSALALLAG